MATARGGAPTSDTARQSRRCSKGPEERSCAAYGDLNARQWEFVVLVRYPSRKAFLDMVTSPAYAQANVHRENAFDDHVILAATETYSKFPSELTQR